jgi:hypothetical protein
LLLDLQDSGQLLRNSTAKVDFFESIVNAPYNVIDFKTFVDHDVDHFESKISHAPPWDTGGVLAPLRSFDNRVQLNSSWLFRRPATLVRSFTSIITTTWDAGGWIPILSPSRLSTYVMSMDLGWLLKKPPDAVDNFETIVGHQGIHFESEISHAPPWDTGGVLAPLRSFDNRVQLNSSWRLRRSPNFVRSFKSVITTTWDVGGWIPILSPSRLSTYVMSTDLGWLLKKPPDAVDNGFRVNHEISHAPRWDTVGLFVPLASFDRHVLLNFSLLRPLSGCGSQTWRMVMVPWVVGVALSDFPFDPGRRR